MTGMIVGLFHSSENASSAINALVHSGIPRQAIDVVYHGPGLESGGEPADGLVQFLMRNGVPVDDARNFDEGVRHGGTLISVRADDVHVASATEILNRYGTVDIRGRAGLLSEQPAPMSHPGEIPEKSAIHHQHRA